ncbi:hypothetical protein C440_11123 [Haloferax mucosum ATCC BAA-1512]|uniref:Blue (type 1) copper domain-containing protein n=1 Tax=Haloferax mucosum ATCC BAA-1512 TaxID=662479 RepID=M0IE83_9EURY|nr:plastocyanin/azurin family copper-binding protein [Haloferax mucosum]ELZ94168.1 hypothetical protein C440_11123 [Haloferax mucosum ATCC BAA-1512]
MTNKQYDEQNDDQRFPVARRSILRAAAASTLLGVGTGPAVARGDRSEKENGPPGNGGSGGGPTPNELDSIFGFASVGPNPCSGDVGSECFESFKPPVRPAHEVEFRIDIPGLVFALAGQGVLTEETIGNLNAAVEDGELTAGELTDPDAEVTVQTQGGPMTVTIEEIAELLIDTLAFNFDPAGLAVKPGDIVLFSAETPDHAVAAYHERHGRQNRVPDDVGPFSSPLVPVGGYWLYRFETTGVYDVYCPPHEAFGMVMRIVVCDDGVPEPSVEETGRPPEAESLFPIVLGGLDPNIPSPAEVLASAALSPENIVDQGTVSWNHVVEEHRASG